MSKMQFSAIILFVFSFSRVSGYAHYMLTNEQDCKNAALTLGYSPIMASGGTVVSDTSGRTITAVTTSSNVSLSSGSTCGSSETITIGVTSFTANTGSLVMEARGIIL